MPVILFKVRGSSKPIVRRCNRVFIRREQRLALVRRPHVELAFDMLRISVERGVVTPFVGLHFTHGPSRGLGHHHAKPLIVRDAPRVAIERQQRPVVIQHLLEMRNGPRLIHAIARKATTQMIVDTALGHVRQRRAHYFQRLRIVVDGVSPQTKGQFIGMRKLGRMADATMHAIKHARKIRQRGIQWFTRKRGCVTR